MTRWLDDSMNDSITRWLDEEEEEDDDDNEEDDDEDDGDDEDKKMLLMMMLMAGDSMMLTDNDDLDVVGPDDVNGFDHDDCLFECCLCCKISRISNHLGKISGRCLCNCPIFVDARYEWQGRRYSMEAKPSGRETALGLACLYSLFEGSGTTAYSVTPGEQNIISVEARFQPIHSKHSTPELRHSP